MRGLIEYLESKPYFYYYLFLETNYKNTRRANRGRMALKKHRSYVKNGVACSCSAGSTGWRWSTLRLITIGRTCSWNKKQSQSCHVFNYVHSGVKSKVELGFIINIIFRFKELVNIWIFIKNCCKKKAINNSLQQHSVKVCTSIYKN